MQGAYIHLSLRMHSESQNIFDTHKHNLKYFNNKILYVEYRVEKNKILFYFLCFI